MQMSDSFPHERIVGSEEGGGGRRNNTQIYIAHSSQDFGSFTFSVSSFLGNLKFGKNLLQTPLTLVNYYQFIHYQ